MRFSSARCCSQLGLLLASIWSHVLMAGCPTSSEALASVDLSEDSALTVRAQQLAQRSASGKPLDYSSGMEARLTSRATAEVLQYFKSLNPDPVYAPAGFGCVEGNGSIFIVMLGPGKSQGDSQLAESAGEVAVDSGNWQRDMLDAHNHYRCLHGVPPLKWNDEVAAYAQGWANGGQFQHSDSYGVSTPGPLAENLATGQRSAFEVVSDWYSENTAHDYASNGFNGATGHFSAMIWKEAAYLGCGRNRNLWTCNYWSGKTGMDCSTPNMGGCFAAQVLAPVQPAPGCGKSE